MADLKVKHVHILLNIVRNPVSNIQIILISSDLLRSLTLWFYLSWLIPVFDFRL